MIVFTDGAVIQILRDLFSDALFGSGYTVLGNEWDLFIVNLLVTVSVFLTVYLFFKIVFGLISLFGG